jgi:predicted protein tyrosine phosphatase
MIHVCSLARLHATLDESGARSIVTLLRLSDQVQRPSHISPRNHLVLAVDDINVPIDGYTAPADEHIQRLLELFRRHQPLDRGSLRRGLRAQPYAR